MRSGLFPTPCLTPKPAQFLLRGLFLCFLLPTAHSQTLVLGIAGGWEDPQAPWTITKRIAHDLEAAHPSIAFATISNHDLATGRKLIRQHIDTNHDGRLDPTERANARLILYGQSLGGSATIRLCRWLKKQQVPVRLNVQIDSVGLRDGKIPSNVKQAANLYQLDFKPLHGQAVIRPESPRETQILGNWRYFYPKEKLIDTSVMPRLHRMILNPHLKMEFDPEVIAKVEDLISTTLRNW